jgi:uncharacterized cofD-like protein
MNKKPSIIVIGGGTGTFTVLSGLKKYPFDLAAVVTMADDGGSTGVLRDELGVLPPGDIRQCLVALSTSPTALRKLMNYRFAEGGLAGHSFGNLLLSALEKMTGSFDRAVEIAGEILRIEGRVIPSTLSKVGLAAKLSIGKTVRGQSAIHNTILNDGLLERIYLEPDARANPKALRAIRNADMVLIGPGDLYSSLVPNLLVAGIPEAVRRSRAKKVYVCNLMTKVEHTDRFTVGKYVAVIERHLGGPVDAVIYNTERPSGELLSHYAREGEHIVEFDGKNAGRAYVGARLLNKNIYEAPKGDPLARSRSLIRHDPTKLARVIAKIISG